MKQLKRKVFALLVAACLICMNIVPVFADTTANATAPAVADVRQEAQLTASYLMNSIDFSTYADTGVFYGVSRDLFLSIRSGYDCSSQLATYLEFVKNNINEDGTLNIDNGYNAKNYYISGYTYLIMILSASGIDATDFNGINIVSAFDKKINTFTVDDLSNNSMNIYHLGSVYSVVNAYKDTISNSDKVLANIKEALLAACTANGNGIDNWGNSIDNNGFVFPFFASLYDTDADVKKVIDSAADYSKQGILADGTSFYSLDYPASTGNTNSSGMNLAFFAQYGNSDVNTAVLYNALVNTFKSNSGNGAYLNTYTGLEDFKSATPDALQGIITYLYSLEGKANPFDITADVKAIADAKNAPIEEPSTEPATPSTEPSTEPAAGNNTASPATGDVNVYMYLLLAAACAATFAGVTAYNKKSAR